MTKKEKAAFCVVLRALAVLFANQEKFALDARLADAVRTLEEAL